jgi:tetratricopeptide (TPR) repeat protein
MIARSTLPVFVLLCSLVACGPRPRPLVEIPAPDPAGLPSRSAARLTELLEASRAREVTSTPRSELSADAFLELGHACLARSFTDCAVAAYANAVSLAPERPEAWLFEAQAMVTAGRPADAAASLRRALDLGADEPTVPLRLAEALAESGATDEAEVVIDAALAKANVAPPIESALRLLRGRLQAETAPEDALVELDRALALTPAANIIEHQRAEVLRRLGRADEAEAALARAGTTAIPLTDREGRIIATEKVRAAFDALIDLAATEQGRDPNVLLGFADAQFGNVDGAAGGFEQHLAGAGALPPAIDARLTWIAGVMQARLGKHLEARGRFSRAAELDPTLVEANTRLAASHLALGDGDAALGVLAEVLATGRDTVAALDLRSQIWLAAGRAREADRDLRQALAVDPTRGDLQLRLAELAERTGRPEEALALYQAALEHTASARDRALALFRMARLRAGGGDLASVEADLRRAVGLDPRLLDAQLALGGLLLNAGRVDEALTVWRQASLHSPASPVPRRAEATALLVAQRWEEATERLTTSLETFPDDTPLLSTLARHLSACPDLERRDPVRGLELARRALAAENTPANRETFAMALAENGDFSGAAAEQRRLIEDLGQRAGARRPALLANLARYERGERCCAGG